jgi:hypothetical protein
MGTSSSANNGRYNKSGDTLATSISANNVSKTKVPKATANQRNSSNTVSDRTSRYDKSGNTLATLISANNGRYNKSGDTSGTSSSTNNVSTTMVPKATANQWNSSNGALDMLGPKFLVLMGKLSEHSHKKLPI